MRKILRLLAVFLLSVALSACGNGTAQGNRESEAALEAGASMENGSVNESENAVQDTVVNESEKASQNSTGDEAESTSQNSAEDEAEDGSLEKEGSGQEAAEGTEVTSQEQENPAENDDGNLPEDGTYTTRDDVALYIHLYGKLPSNFITKKEAESLGWEGGSLEPYAPGKCIGGSRFGNYEGLLPEKEGRVYSECDIDTLGQQKRGAKRIVFSNDGLIYYTEDHYESFELLYGEE